MHSEPRPLQKSGAGAGIRRSYRPRPSANPNLIVGAGPAGLECAWTLLRAGGAVTIAEARDVAGGRVTREAALPGLNAWARVRDHRLYQINRHAEASLYLESPLTASDLAEFGADAVVIATGSTWRADGVGSSGPAPVADFASVFSADDVMGWRA